MIEPIANRRQQRAALVFALWPGQEARAIEPVEEVRVFRGEPIQMRVVHVPGVERGGMGVVVEDRPDFMREP